MQHYTCDLCQGTCDSSGTRRWEYIQGDLGLEVVVLRGSLPVGDVHICSSCLLKMFYVMLERDPNTNLRLLKTGLVARELILSEKEKKAELVNKALDELAFRLKEKEKTLSILEARLADNQHNLIKEDIDIYKQKELVRQAEQRGYQRAIDEFNFPEYHASVAARERKRLGGSI